MQDSSNKGVGIWGNVLEHSVPATQLFCEPKSAPKKKSILSS